jgi:tetratricopeptide (TPR) repeat protein/KaiC/GvpD/RAD55 family RecA-like ATPase
MAVPVLPSSTVSGDVPGRPVRTGVFPALADGFLPRTETAPRLPSALLPGAIVVLAPERPATSGQPESSGRSAGQAPTAASSGGMTANWAGITGKTQVAAAYADSLYRSGAAVIWADASSRASVLASYATAAATLGVNLAQGADATARRLLAALDQSAQPWLVVLDGLRDPADVRSLIPSGPACMTLITTAGARLIPDSWHALILPVGPLSAREAMSYLRGRLRSDWDQRAGMINLVTEIGGEPGALAQASGVIAVSPLSCRQYADKLYTRRDQMTRAAGAVPPVAMVTLALAVERADQLDPAAWPTMVIAAVLDGQRVPAAVFHTGAVAGYVTGQARPDVSATARTLRLLTHLGLAAVDPQPDSLIVRFSQPVLDAVRGALTREDHDRALAVAVAGVTEAWPDDEPPVWLGCMLAICSASAWRAAGDRLWTDGNCPRLLRRAGEFLISAGMLGAALPFWANLSATAERLLDPDHPDALMIAGRVAALHLEAGEPARAAVRYEWISSQLQRRPDADQAAQIAAQLDLGRSLVADGQFGKAVAVFGLAAAEYRQVLGPDHLDTVAATELLAAACLQAEERARAITLYRQALADRIRLQGARRPDAIAARQRLASAYLATGDIKAAISEYKKVVADRQRELGENHLDTIAAIGDLGVALQAAGRSAQAVLMLEQARAGHEQLLGTDHRDTLARCADLARAYNAIGWIVDAAVLLRETAERCDRLLPQRDPLTADIRKLLASISGR